jgi:hypothetical protein
MDHQTGNGCCLGYVGGLIESVEGKISGEMIRLNKFSVISAGIMAIKKSCLSHGYDYFSRENGYKKVLREAIYKLDILF